jgi:RNA polymerase sigma-70 factor (sigma-E family)
LRTAHLITADAGEAEDLVQECLWQVARRWRRIGAMDRPLAYARRMLVRLAIRGATKRELHRAELDVKTLEAAAPSSGVDDFGTREELRTALRQLAPRQRAVLVLRYFHDLSESEIADVLGCPAGTIKSTASRSLAQLRDLVETPL